MLPSCSCIMSILSIKSLSILVIVVLNYQDNNSIPAILKSDNLDDMNNLLKDTIFQNTQEKIDYLNRPMYLKYMELIINNIPKQKAPGQQGECHKNLRKKLNKLATISF